MTPIETYNISNAVRTLMQNLYLLDRQEAGAIVSQLADVIGVCSTLPEKSTLPDDQVKSIFTELIQAVGSCAPATHPIYNSNGWHAKNGFLPGNVNQALATEKAEAVGRLLQKGLSNSKWVPLATLLSTQSN